MAVVMTLVGATRMYSMQACIQEGRAGQRVGYRVDDRVC